MSIPYTNALGEELRKRGIQISVKGCGCCGSPWVQVKIDGVLVVADDHVSINTLGDDE